MINDASKKLTELSPEAKRALLTQLLREKARVNEQPEWLPITHNQKALWFLQRLAPDSAAYNLLYAARIRSQLDKAALQRALHTLARRYPILTATYKLQNGVPVLQTQKNQTLTLEEIDATGQTLEALKQQLQAESNLPIDLARGPVLRFKLYQRAENDYILGIIIHHIAADFWALDILVDELYLLYVVEKSRSLLAVACPWFSK